MNTTALFVELIVIGTGAAIWLIILLLSIFGYTWIPWKETTALVALIPVLSVVYVLGIVVDYLAFLLYGKWDKRLRRQKFINKEESESARIYVYTYATINIINRLEYDRSRIRIVRAWSINCFILAISTLIFVWSQLSLMRFSLRLSLSIFSALAFGIGIVSTLYVWRTLSLGYYGQIAQASVFLKNEGIGKSIDVK
ncbi:MULTISPECIES: hypothetical protein [unclassified Nostoc]|uniref:hypothetical protein n=1 Tax=unclassified Nostoc TaxID=2593658 RepID=UPI002AD2F002|nr:hypothetical protein [Nostoc sp. DedQUE03]MDZ7976379.1 hypothetical protein [Nostoc sp. DedQUE03]MDZ8047993.1 hypothetical protein [Nostoc sp. DedQUE02]